MRASWVAVAGVVVGLALALPSVLRRPAPATGGGEQQQAQATAIAADLDARIRETSAGVQARAATLSELPRLGAAVATDQATLRDLTQDELMFRTRPNETIEIGQLPKGGAPSSLLKLPAD